ncbi:MAG: hypothetical protein OXD34_07840 [bacterium]|nr:hypothetical protein [bacterium]
MAIEDKGYEVGQLDSAVSLRSVEVDVIDNVVERNVDPAPGADRSASRPLLADEITGILLLFVILVRYQEGAPAENILLAT